MENYTAICIRSGYVWWSGPAESPEDATRRAYTETSGDDGQSAEVINEADEVDA